MSQNLDGIIFDSCFGRQTVKIDKNREFNNFSCTLGQNRGQILSKLNSESTFGIPSSKRCFLTPNMLAGLRLYYRLPLVFSKFYLLCENQKSSFYGIVGNDAVFLFISHGKGLA